MWTYVFNIYLFVVEKEKPGFAPMMGIPVPATPPSPPPAPTGLPPMPPVLNSDGHIV